mmetsp:Transcript_118682/g.378362  ORF Transcript_118682/g.378362 Transcript_118682/m.378362 type:complete len:228 (+) Transcript_118682:1525-2208(+)
MLHFGRRNLIALQHRATGLLAKATLCSNVPDVIARCSCHVAVFTRNVFCGALLLCRRLRTLWEMSADTQHPILQCGQKTDTLSAISIGFQCGGLVNSRHSTPGGCDCALVSAGFAGGGHGSKRKKSLLCEHAKSRKAGGKQHFEILSLSGPLNTQDRSAQRQVQLSTRYFVPRPPAHRNQRRVVVADGRQTSLEVAVGQASDALQQRHRCSLGASDLGTLHVSHSPS